jgi:hypothetical protein
MDKLNPKDYEVRVVWYGAPVLTPNDFKMLRFKLEMEEHYRQEQENHDLLMQALLLKAKQTFWRFW